MDLTYLSPKTEKRPSRIQGRGLFAKGGITRGEIVVVKVGRVMTRAQRASLGPELDDTEVQIADELFNGPATP